MARTCVTTTLVRIFGSDKRNGCLCVAAVAQSTVFGAAKFPSNPTGNDFTYDGVPRECLFNATEEILLWTYFFSAIFFALIFKNQWISRFLWGTLETQFFEKCRTPICMYNLFFGTLLIYCAHFLNDQHKSNSSKQVAASRLRWKTTFIFLFRERTAGYEAVVGAILFSKSFAETQENIRDLCGNTNKVQRQATTWTGKIQHVIYNKNKSDCAEFLNTNIKHVSYGGTRNVLLYLALQISLAKAVMIQLWARHWSQVHFTLMAPLSKKKIC